MIKKTDTNGLVTATVLNTKMNEADKKILDTTSLVTITVCKRKIGEVKNKIPWGTKRGTNETVVVSTNVGIFARFFHKMLIVYNSFIVQNIF